MKEVRYNIFISFENYNGGVNNLQIAKVYFKGSCLKIFTSKKRSAKSYAKKWIKKQA